MVSLLVSINDTVAYINHALLIIRMFTVRMHDMEIRIVDESKDRNACSLAGASPSPWLVCGPPEPATSHLMQVTTLGECCIFKLFLRFGYLVFFLINKFEGDNNIAGL